MHANEIQVFHSSKTDTDTPAISKTSASESTESSSSRIPWYENLDDFISLPQIKRLILSPNGQTAIIEVTEINAKKTQYTSALWLIDIHGQTPARRLTFSTEGESGAAFTHDGDVLFLSSRPQSNSQDEPTSAIWKLPLNGGEAQILAQRSGGFNAIYTTPHNPRITVRASVFPGATNEAEDAEMRKKRKETTCSAIMHSSITIRSFNHDLGPEVNHLFADKIISDNPEKIEFLDQTPHITNPVTLGELSLSPDGNYAIATWTIPHAVGYVRSILMCIDLTTTESFICLNDPLANLSNAKISPDGKWLIFQRQEIPTPEKTIDVTAHIISLADLSQGKSLEMNDAIPLASHWDNWIREYIWLYDSTGIIFTAYNQGCMHIFRLNLKHNNTIINPDTTPQAITQDDYSYGSIQADPTATYLYALRSSLSRPTHPIRIDLTTGEISEIPSIELSPSIPGIVENIESTASDGTPVRCWLLQPNSEDSKDPTPLIVDIHGGPIHSWISSWYGYHWFFVAQGYAVLLPDPALSLGYGHNFLRRGWGQWGKTPYTDILTITDAVATRDDINSDHIAIMGGSFGGYMSNWIAGQTNRFRAIVTIASLWALDQFQPTTDIPWFLPSEFTPTALLENSPHKYVENISTPMLVIHGDKDYRVPIGEALRLWNELLTKSALPINEDGHTEHRFLYFPDESHGFNQPQNIKTLYQEILSFINKHMTGDAPLEAVNTSHQ